MLFYRFIQSVFVSEVYDILRLHQITEHTIHEIIFLCLMKVRDPYKSARDEL